MKAQHFNFFEFRKILDLLESDPIYSKKLFEEYIKKYPNDYSAQPYYCSCLIMLGEFELAERILSLVEGKVKDDVSYNKIDNFQKNLFHARLQLFSYQERYEELYKYCIENFEKIKDREMEPVLFYSRKKTGRIDLNRREENSYLYRQIVRYEETDFLNHIKKHLLNKNDNLSEDNRSVFVEDFPMAEIIEEIKKYIPSEKRLCSGFFDNIYYFKYDGCGRVDRKIVDYFKVVCFHGTKDFITICPVVGNKNLPYVDLNYLVSNNESTKVKRLSQIDKFNQKYKRSI